MLQATLGSRGDLEPFLALEGRAGGPLGMRPTVWRLSRSAAGTPSDWRQQRALVGQVLASAKPGTRPQALVEQWLGRDDATLKYTLGMFADMRNLRGMDYPTLSVAVRRLAQIVSAGGR